MKTNCLFPTLILGMTAASLHAGDGLSLDKDFSFRLTPPELKQPSATPAPVAPANPAEKRGAPLTTPEGAPLPPGSRAFQFNGQTFYLIPL